MPDSKTEILARIGSAKFSDLAPLERTSTTVSKRDRHSIVEQFAEYADEYRAHVHRTSPSELKAAIAASLVAHGSTAIVIAADLPVELRPETLELVEDAGFDNSRLDEFQAVVTSCALAIAETGTIVLDAGPGQGRRAITLIPDHHVCVVFEDQVVDSVPEAVGNLAQAVRSGQPLTWISGPSATSDIELSRVEGVHGPRRLDVILVAR